jgi:uncharacterized protein (DUF4415 family)
MPARKAAKNEEVSTFKEIANCLEQVGALKDDRIDFSDMPELTPEMLARPVVRRGLKPAPRKEQLTIRVDSDVLEWYEKQGPGLSNPHQYLAPRLYAASAKERLTEAGAVSRLAGRSRTRD